MLYDEIDLRLTDGCDKWSAVGVTLNCLKCRLHLGLARNGICKSFKHRPGVAAQSAALWVHGT
jgi:hypothetical protein